MSDEASTAGTKKNYRLFQIKCPDVLLSCSPTPESQCFLYTIDMIPTFDANDENLKVFHNLYSTEHKFAILTTKKLPKLGSMRFYLTFGEVCVTINHLPHGVQLSSQAEIMRLRNFHAMLFKDLLNTTAPFLAYDFQNNDNSYFIVPIVGKQINWQLVNAFQSLSTVKSVDEAVRKRLTFNPDDLLHKMVTPFYRSDQDQRYVVTKIHQDLSPSTRFPNSNYKDYSQYYYEKYGQRITNPHQFLIEVKGVTTHLNRLVPGNKMDGSKNNIRIIEYMVPELCHNFKFPGDLYLKATLLPSTLHRLHYLLHAETVRQTINTFIGNYVDYSPEPVLNSVIAKKQMNDNELDAQEEVEKNHVKGNKLSIDELEEPKDLIRNLPVLYNDEIDYYYDFINDAVKNMLINEEQQAPNPVSKCFDLASIDELPEIKFKACTKDIIELLKIKMDTPTRGPRQCDLLAAITSKTSSDVFDMERLEVIGDAFLKFGASLFLLREHPTWHEGFLSNVKGKLVSNRNLCYIAIDMGINMIVKVNNFLPKSGWIPPLFAVPQAVQVIHFC